MKFVEFFRRMLQRPPYVDHTEAAESLFRNISEKFSLEILHDDVPVELSMILPKQDGLKFEIWVNLQNMDELWFGLGDKFSCSFFPFEDVRDVFRNALEGFISGEHRLLVHSNAINGRAVKIELQQRNGSNWSTIFTDYERFCWPWLRLDETVITN